MTEEQIERRVETMTDHLDRMLMSGGMNQDAYDKAMRELNAWAEAKRLENSARRGIDNRIG